MPGTCCPSARSAQELAITLDGPPNTVVALTFERQRLVGSLVTLSRQVMRERVEEVTAVPTAVLLDLPAFAVHEFRLFATRQGVEIPEGADADARIERMLLGRFGRTRWGDRRFYRPAAVLDPDVAAAVDTFETAGQILAAAAHEDETQRGVPPAPESALMHEAPRARKAAIPEGFVRR